MDQILAYIKDGKENYYVKILSGQPLFPFIDIQEVFEYEPDTALDGEQWYVINNFSEKTYCIDLFKKPWDSTNYVCEKIDIDKIEYICSYQEDNYFYFQKINKKTVLKNKRFLSFGDLTKINEQKKSIIVISDIPDAIYDKEKDSLFFKKLETIASIFKGIDVLYRDATNEEVEEFLYSDFVMLDNNFEVQKVGKLNRKRIAMAIEIMKTLDNKQKDDIFSYIREYHPDLSKGDNKFKVSSDNDLKNVLYGIEQRYFTTPITSEKKVATSAMKV